MKEKITRIILTIAFLTLAVGFADKFGRPAILRAYVISGIGDCVKIPIFCMAPSQKLTDPPISDSYIKHLQRNEFPTMKISTPKGFSVVQETIKKVYYNKKRKNVIPSIIYVFHQPPDFFITLFPQVKKAGITNDHEFLRHVMGARLTQVNNLTDVFFMVMKGIFIPDIGPQKDAQMIEFSLGDKSGFINYNITEKGSYFDCDIVDRKSGFYKVYIKDRDGELGILEVFAIISTAQERVTSHP